MSVPTTQQAKLVPFTLSEDNVTFKSVVCLKVWNFNGTTPVQKEKTQCGTHTALDALESSFDFEGVANSTPNGATEVSHNDILGYWKNQTLVYAKVQPTGMYIQGQGYITNFRVTAQVGNLVSFTATFEMDGDPDITA
jgi:hypothetical protein